MSTFKNVIVCTGSKKVSDIANSQLYYDITQRDSQIVTAIFFKQLFDAHQNKIQTNEALTEDEKKYLSSYNNVRNGNFNETKMIIAYHDGIQTCIDGSHRDATSKAAYNDMYFTFPTESNAETAAEKYILEIRNKMIKNGFPEKAKRFKLSDLPEEVREEYAELEYDVHIIIVHEKMNKEQLSQYYGSLFLTANSGKTASSNDKINANYASKPFYAVRKELAKYVANKGTKLSDFPLLSKMINTKSSRKSLEIFKEGAKKSNKSVSTIEKLLIRCSDNAYWTETNSMNVIKEICERHSNDSASTVRKNLIKLVECFAMAVELFNGTTALNKINVWSAFAHVFCQADGPINNGSIPAENMPNGIVFDKSMNPDFVKNLVGMFNHDVQLGNGVIISMDNEKLTTSPQRFRHTKDIATVIYDTYCNKSTKLGLCVKSK